MTFLRRISLFFLLIMLFIAGCRKSSNANWDVDAVFPVINSVLNIKNFISDTIFNADNTGLLHLKINREVAALKLDSLLQIPDTTVVTSFTSPSIFAQPLLPGNGFSPTVDDIKIDFPDGITLKTATIRSGALEVTFSNDLTQPLDLLYTLPTVRKQNQSLKIMETIPPGVKSLKRSYDLSGYSFDFTGTSGTKFNTIAQTCSLTLSPSATSVMVNYGQGATVEVGYTKMTPDFVLGYFGQQKVNLPADTAEINLLENFRASNFMLADASMDFTLINEFGVGFSGGLGNIKAINEADNKTVVLNTNQLNSININPATRVGNTVTPSKKLFSFNKTNSNITAFISALPNKLTYSGSIKMNPVEISPGNGNVSGYNDFAYYNTGVRIVANIDIPMKFTADYFALTSNSIIDFSGNKQLDGVNSGRFIVSATNGFPFSAKVQAYMYDAQNVLIDSIFVPGANVIRNGNLNAQNEVDSPSESKIYIPVNQNKLQNLTRCKKVKIISYLLMPPNPPDIKILEKYEIGINITAEVNYNVDLGG